jgi:hypothetical protein
VELAARSVHAEQSCMSSAIAKVRRELQPHRPA